MQKPRAFQLNRYSRHDVAFLYVNSCIYNEFTRCVPAGILWRRATVALMTGCEALLTMYRIGKKSRGGLPSGNPARLRDRVGQYGESRQRTLRAVSEHGPTGIHRSMTRYSALRVSERLQETNVPARDPISFRRPSPA